MSDRTKSCDVIWQTWAGNHECQLNEDHGGPHRCCSCSATLLAPVEPVPASEIVKLRHVIEEARAIAWDLYENPWDIPDAARDEISDLHNLLARAIDRSAPVPAPRLDADKQEVLLSQCLAWATYAVNEFNRGDFGKKIPTRGVAATIQGLRDLLISEGVTLERFQRAESALEDFLSAPPVGTQPKGN